MTEVDNGNSGEGSPANDAVAAETKRGCNYAGAQPGSKKAKVLQSGSGSLPVLGPRQSEALQRAKLYCQDVTAKAADTKRLAERQAQMMTLLEAADRQKALTLMRRIYIGNIYYELGEEDVRSAFCHFGTIKSIDMCWEGGSGHHKGYAFVEYESPDSAQLARDQMDGVTMGGRSIKVGQPNNVPQAAVIIQNIREEASKYNRIFVASVHTDLNEADVKSVFEPFGSVKDIRLAPDVNPGKHRGWGYIEYHSLYSATDAIASMNLFNLGGQFLRVRRAVTPPAPLHSPGSVSSVVTGMPLMATAGTSSSNHPTAPASRTTSGFDDVPPMNTPACLQEIQTKLEASNEKSGGTERSLEQEEGMSISGSNARVMAMKKLSRKSDLSVVVLLRNMVSDIDEDLI